MNEIIIEYKKIKNIYIRVKKDLNIYITAPKKISKEYIYDLVEKRRDWIDEKIEDIKKKNIYDVSLKKLISGDDIFYLGKRYMLKVIESKKEGIEVEGKLIYLFVKNNQNTRKKHIILDTWYKEESLKLFEMLLKKHCSIMDLQINSFTVKKLKSKWGSCDILKKHITLNLELIKYPVHTIEYIIIHELAHLIHPNHSKDFYDVISFYMPKWKEEKKILENFFNNL